jgi:hypothetical protein
LLLVPRWEHRDTRSRTRHRRSARRCHPP